MVGGLMAYKETAPDGTIRIGGQVVPTGGSIPTTASVVSYGGSSNLQSTNVEGALDELDAEKAPLLHTHDDRYYTEVEVTNLLAGKAAASHNHDDRYLTEVEVTNLLAGKAATGHIHDDRYYTEAETNARIAAALGTVEAHANPSFDLVSMSTVGPGGDVVPSRLYPDSWGSFWGNGSPTTRPVLEADPNVTYTGSGFSYKVTLPATDSGQALTSSIFAVAPGSIVNIEAWVRGTGPRAFITIYTNQDVDPDFFQPGNAGGDTVAIKPTTTWQKVNLSFTVPANHNRCRFMLRAYADGLNGSTPGIIWWDETKSRVQIIPPSGVVPGEIKMWPGATAPAGYLFCRGGTFSAAQYPILAAVLGNTYGTRSGDTCYLPDFRARSPIGSNGAAVPAAGGNSYSLGQKHGHEAMQQHDHGTYGRGSTWAANNPWGAPDIYFPIGAYGGDPGGGGNYLVMSSAWNKTQLSGTGGSGNVHPVLALNFIIKHD